MAKARKSRKSAKPSRKSRKPSRKHRGGGAGQGGWGFTGETVMGGLANASVNQPQASCLAVPRFGEVSVTPTGLPFQAGGRYSFDLTSQIAPATPFQGGIPPVVRIPCEGAHSNPLNPQLGGAGAATAALYVPTAGYSQSASTWVGRDGTPALLSIPYEARGTPSLNPACLTTGGSRKKAKKHTKRR